MKLGVDIVYIPRIKRLMQNKDFVKKVFHSSECKLFTPEHLAGIFASKEAFFKAVNKKTDWLDIEVKKHKSGKPRMNLSNELEFKVLDVSISHDKDYAIAMVLIK